MSRPSSAPGAFEPTIALVFSPEPWVEELHRHLADHGGARVRQIVLEPSVALEEEYDTLVVSHRWPALSKPLIAGVHDRGRRVLGVFDPDEPQGRDHLHALGVDAVIATPASAAEFVAMLTDLGGCRGASALPVAELALVGAHPSLCSTGVSMVTAVAGPPGAGTTEIAIELGRAAAAKGHETVVVDGDESRAAIATRLALPTEPNLRTALDAVEHGLGDLAASVIPVGPARLRMLGGLPGADAAAHVRGGDVVDVLKALTGSHAYVVADLGSTWSQGIARTVVQEAGVVVGVGAATPVGVSRLLAWIAELRTGALSAPLHLVVNCAPADRFRRNEIATEIARTFEPASLVFVPFDRKVDAAAWQGSLVGRGPFTAALAPLAELVSPRPVPRRASERRQARRRAIAMGPRVRTAGYE